LYGPAHTEMRGATFLFNLTDKAGQVYPFQRVEDGANRAGISLRSGCFCNPGIDELNHGISAEELETFFENRKTADYHEMIGHLGRWRGALRISLGYPTIKSDIEKFFSFAGKILDKNL